jgi:hypothetical protein
MGQQVNTRCELKAKIKQLYYNNKYLRLDPKPSDLIMIRVIKARTNYRCKDIR